MAPTSAISTPLEASQLSDLITLRVSPNRDIAADIAAAGFDLETVDRFSYRPLQFMPPHAHIIGTARKAG